MGESVGMWVGAAVGVAVGLSVGASVGAAVGAVCFCWVVQFYGCALKKLIVEVKEANSLETALMKRTELSLIDVPVAKSLIPIT